MQDMNDRNRVTPPPVKAPCPLPKPPKQSPAKAMMERQGEFFLDRMVRVNSCEIRVLQEHYNVSDKVGASRLGLPAAAAVLGIVLASPVEAQTVLGNASSTVSLG